MDCRPVDQVPGLILWPGAVYWMGPGFAYGFVHVCIHENVDVVFSTKLALFF